jgi:hypothetical protein
LWPVEVVSPFHVPLGHLALDDVRIRSSSACGIEPTQQHRDGALPEALDVFRVLRGEIAHLGQ